MSVTTGDLFTKLLLAVTPTALGEALNGSPTQISAWSTALQANAVWEVASVVTLLNGYLNDASFSLLFNALLTPVTFNGQQQPIAQVLKNLIWLVGKQAGVITIPWMTPPHPGGATDIGNMIANLPSFDETH